jgi:hypothetical protein
MTRRRRWPVAVIVAMLVAITATSCDDTGSATATPSGEPAWKEYPRGDGPMVFGDPGKERSAVCSPHKSRDLTDGGVVRNPGPESITVTRVSLLYADGLELVEAYFGRITTNNSMGYAPLWPPPDKYLRESGYTFKDVVPAEGAVLTPGGNDGRWQLLVHVRRSDLTKPAGYVALQIDYRVGDNEYFRTNSTRLELRHKC